MLVTVITSARQQNQYKATPEEATMAEEREKMHLEDCDLREGDRKWKWENSWSKAKIMQGLRNGDIPLASDGDAGSAPRAIYSSNPIFAEETVYNKEDRTGKKVSVFAKRLAACREHVAREKRHREDDVAGYHRDRHLHPMTTHDSVGRPHWQGSEAWTIVREHVVSTFDDDGHGGRIHRPNRMLKYKQIVASNPHAFRYFSDEAIRKHLFQELRTQKYYNYRNSKKKQDGPR
jgi:hypothetical protein